MELRLAVGQKMTLSHQWQMGRNKGLFGLAISPGRDFRRDPLSLYGLKGETDALANT